MSERVWCVRFARKRERERKRDVLARLQQLQQREDAGGRELLERFERRVPDHGYLYVCMYCKVLYWESQ